MRSNDTSPQAKRYVVSSIVNTVYDLPHEMRNELQLRIYEIMKWKKNLKLIWIHRLMPSSPLKK